MLPADVAGDPTERTPADNATLRNVFVIGPDKKIKLILIYPMTTGPQLRRGAAGDRLAAADRQAPGRDAGQWQHGDDVIIAGSVSDEEAREIYPDGWESPRPYIRIVPQPR